MALIALDHIGRRFGSHVALRDVSLHLEPGRIGLLGPNGAGKSTLLKLLMGLLPPSEGQGRFMDIDIRSGGIQLRRLIGYMSEADALVPGLRGAEYVALAGQLYGMPRGEAHRRAHEVLTYLGLEEARYRRLEEYSTGMKQRLKLAQALVHDPPLLLLDEPTSGLDPAGRDAMLRLMLTLAREHGKSFILSTHLLNDVERVCETVVILYRGRVLRQGRTAELRMNRFDRYRLQVEGRVSAFADDLKAEGVEVLTASRGRKLVAVGNGAEETDAPNDGRQPLAELTVLVPSAWRTRLFFTLADNRGVVIRGLQRDDEDLEQLFHRTIAENGRDGA
jgi:ABC-2 type transport system ATP-binding protein